MKIPGCTVMVERIERLEVVGPSEQRNQIADMLYAKGYRPVGGGPYTDREMFPKVDSTRFKWIFEKYVTG